MGSRPPRSPVRRARSKCWSGTEEGADVSESLTVEDYEAAARGLLPQMVFDYFAGGAGQEWTLDENRRAFGRWSIRPRVLVDVEHMDTRTSVLGTEIPFPILLAPTA